ncbi:MAG: PriCT-2 domain-containing protein, partial [Albidovulum sp.]
MSSFKDYVENGWKLCAIQPGTKGPKGEGWQSKERAITNPMVAVGLPGAGLCHAWSGTCALDVDEIDLAAEFLKQRGVDLYGLLNADDAVQIFSGKEGRAKLLYRLDEPLASLKLAPYKAPGKANPNKEEKYHAFELRCASRGGLTVQDVLPPTIHPETGAPYRWVYGNRLFGHWSKLPPIPEELHKLWVDSLAPTGGASAPQAPTGALPEEIERLIADKDPSDYDSWIDIGQRLHHEYRGSAEGFDVWVKWSSRSSKFKGPHDCETHWRSFRHDAAGARTMGGLRAEQVSKPEDFAIIEAPPTEEEDTRIDPMMQRLVGQHLVYVRGLDRYFDTRTRHVFLSDRAVRNAFLPDIPYTMSGDTPKKQDPITWLMGSSERRGRDVQAVGMHPGEGVTFEDGGIRYANCHPPRKAIESLAPTPFEAECFQFIWSRMLDLRYQQWLMKFYAHALKHP